MRPVQDAFKDLQMPQWPDYRLGMGPGQQWLGFLSVPGLLPHRWH
jgi:hypothetical protein